MLPFIVQLLQKGQLISGINMDVTRVRSEFPILQRKIYLNSCSLGPLSFRAMSYLDSFQELWHDLGASAWYGPWLETMEVLRMRVAEFLGTAPEQLALLPSTSAALSVIAESIDYSKRNRVVCTELDFPTLAYQWAVKPDVELVILPSHDGVKVDLEQFAAAVDEQHFWPQAMYFTPLGTFRIWIV